MLPATSRRRSPTGRADRPAAAPSGGRLETSMSSAPAIDVIASATGSPFGQQPPVCPERTSFPRNRVSRRAGKKCRRHANAGLRRRVFGSNPRLIRNGAELERGSGSSIAYAGPAGA